MVFVTYDTLFAVKGEAVNHSPNLGDQNPTNFIYLNSSYGVSVNNQTGVLTGTAEIATKAIISISYDSDSGPQIVSLLFFFINVYYNPIIYTIGQAVNAINTQESTEYFEGYENFYPVSYSISPAFDSGLSLNTETGAITGTPTSQDSHGIFTVTYITNLATSHTTTVQIVNNSLLPVYPSTYVLDDVGTLIYPTNISGTNAFDFSIVDPPFGITINNTTGVIAVNIFSIPNTTNFVVLFDSDYGVLSVVANIIGMRVTYNSFNYMVGFPVNYIPSKDGVEPILYELSTSLPAGLSLNSSTGAITGTPTSSTGNNNNITITMTAPDNTTIDKTFTIGICNAHYDSQYTFLINQPVSISPQNVLNPSGISPFGINSMLSDPIPDGLSYSYSTGTITGETSQLGNFNYILLFQGNYGTYFTFNVQMSIVLSLPDCLTGDSHILTIKGYKPIKSLTTNDYIVTDKKIIRKIKSIYTIQHVGELYRLPKKSLDKIHPFKDVFMSANHKYYHNDREYRPRNHLSQIQINEPITLFHVQLEKEQDNIVVEGVSMESHHE